VNSSYEDLAVVAAVLRGRSLPPELDLTVSPGSRQILDMIVRSGVYADLLASGARILEPACGPCIGMLAAPASGAVSVRTFNRNFPGRSGTQDDRVYLCSPATAAATALRGTITDPRDLGLEQPDIPPGRPHPATDDRQILPPAPPEQAAAIEVPRGPNIKPPPAQVPLPAHLSGRVLIVVGDDISTGDLAMVIVVPVVPMVAILGVWGGSSAHICTDATTTGATHRTRAFDAAGMANLFATDERSPDGQHLLPADIGYRILAHKAEYPAFHPQEIAEICRRDACRVSHKTVQRVLDP
jgi:hypothetical protein